MTFVQRAVLGGLCVLISLTPATLTAASALPKSALSLPTGADADQTRKTCELCTTKDKIFVLPPVIFEPGSGDGSRIRREDQEKILQAMPGGAQAYLHIQARAAGLTAGTAERVITDRVSAFM